MISARLMCHDLVIERATNGTRGERGAPAQTWADTGPSVRGRVAPKRPSGPLTAEVPQLSQGGPVATDYVIYLDAGVDVGEADRIRFATDDGRRFQITSRVEAWSGRLDHLELDARLVTV